MGFREEEAQLTVVLKDGQEIEEYVARAIGSPENPMTDEFLNDKFRQIAGDALGSAERVEELLEALWTLDGDGGDLKRLMCLLRAGDGERVWLCSAGRTDLCDA